MFRVHNISRFSVVFLCLVLLVVVAMGCSPQGDRSAIFSVTALTVVEAAPAIGGDVVVGVRAWVTLVNDPGSFLGGGVNVGDLVTGFYLYDEGAVDTKKNDPREGRYAFNSTPHGINLSVNGLPFNSDPNAVDMTIRLKNDDTRGSPGIPKDSYEARSLSNTDVLPGVGVQDIRIELKDYTAAALASDELLGLFLDLGDWGTLSRVTLQGVDNWTIEADITIISRQSTQSASHDHGGEQIRFHQP